MPAVSQAQRRLMFAAASRKGGAGGVPQSVGKEFANADPGGKLPEYVGKPHGGVIKEVAGEPIGKDDGLIPAQRGEYVIRRSAVKKYGKLFLDSVNEGRFKPPGSRWG